MATIDKVHIGNLIEVTLKLHRYIDRYLYRYIYRYLYRYFCGIKSS